MLFNSAVFLFVFLPLVLGGSFLLRHLGGGHLVYAWLALASLVYYGWWDPSYLVLILISIGLNFFIGQRIVLGEGSGRRAWLLLGLILNLGALGFFKYAGFVVENVAALTGELPWEVRIVLPLGISFFTLQQVAYLLDCYRQPAPYRLVPYSLFVSFFPQLIAGPIVHHKEMMPQFTVRPPSREDYLRLVPGLTLFLVGLFKKTVIADTLSVYVGRAFEEANLHAQVDIFTAWMAALGYTFQIYYDFSAYSDMALGLGMCFGIYLPLNFNSPYQALSIRDFWRRWHITLSRFLRDYLYIPLGGNRRGPSRAYVNLLLTMLIGGFWHGAAWTFVVWGAWHGLLLAGHRAWERRGLNLGELGWLARQGAWLLTFLCVVVGWVFFRAESFGAAFAILQGMVGLGAGLELPPLLHAFTQNWGLDTLLPLHGEMGFYDREFLFFWGLVAFFLIWVRWAPNPQQWMQRVETYLPTDVGKVDAYRGSLPLWRPNLLWGAAIAVMGFWAVKTIFALKPSEFIYFNF